MGLFGDGLEGFVELSGCWREVIPAAVFIFLARADARRPAIGDAFQEGLGETTLNITGRLEQESGLLADRIDQAASALG